MDLIFLESVEKEKIWGREEWLISTHPHGETVIKNTENQGRGLSEIYQDFPLLVKIIEAEDDLSIQVHPYDEYAKKFNSKGKCEFWYVLDAKEGASLIIGHNAENKTEFCNMMENGDWDKLLRVVEVKKGDYFQIEPGTVHAIKGGVKLLEIQQSSDITYRLYDYDRLQNGEKRDLHIKECMETIVFPYKEKVMKNCGDELFSCPFYTIEKLKITKSAKVFSATQPVIAICVEGGGFVDKKEIKTGESFIICQGHTAMLNGNMEFILTYEKRENEGICMKI